MIAKIIDWSWDMPAGIVTMLNPATAKARTKIMGFNRDISDLFDAQIRSIAPIHAAPEGHDNN